MDRCIDEILRTASDGAGIGRDEALALMALPLHGPETYALMHAAAALSRRAFGGKAENHFHIGLNAGPCPFDCRFCSLARKAGVFTESVHFTEEQIIAWAREAEAHGADALNLMTTGEFPFDRLLAVGRLLKASVRTPLVANTRDIDHQEGEALLEAGFVGAYHAVRLREGVDTPLNPRRRIRTLQVFKDVGLLWMNCIEPVAKRRGDLNGSIGLKKGVNGFRQGVWAGCQHTE